MKFQFERESQKNLDCQGFENGEMDSSQAHLLLGRSHQSQSVAYLRFLPQTAISFGKYRAMTVDKYEYCRGVQDMHCPGGASPLPADCPEFIAAIQFNRRLQFSRLLHLLG